MRPVLYSVEMNVSLICLFRTSGSRGVPIGRVNDSVGYVIAQEYLKGCHLCQHKILIGS